MFDSSIRFTSTRRRRRLLASLTLAASLALTACGGDPDDPPSAVRTADNGDVYNDADVTFATEMIQHHAQALVMVDLTQDRTLAPEVRQLAEEIRDAQVPEIERLTDWLTAWDQEVPATMRDHGQGSEDMGGMDHGDAGSGEQDMPGMMSEEDLADLEGASDTEFQDRWLEMMIEHHEGAVAMAEDEVADGAYGDAISMAEDIVSTQQDEIDRMKGLLG